MQQASDKRTAIVTGAARGIGAAIVNRLARDGWNVAASDIDAGALAATAAAVGAHPVVADAGDEGDVRRLVHDATSRFGRLDAIVANAGINANGPLAATSLEA